MIKVAAHEFERQNQLAESLPELGAYLDRAIRTGTFCSYEPY